MRAAQVGRMWSQQVWLMGWKRGAQRRDPSPGGTGAQGCT